LSKIKPLKTLMPKAALWLLRFVLSDLAREKRALTTPQKALLMFATKHSDLIVKIMKDAGVESN